MKKRLFLISVAIVTVGMALASCKGVGIGMEGNIYEKMAIFSLIALTLIAVLLLPFISSTSDSKALARYRELIRNAATLPLSVPELTGNPIYLWDSRKSFQKMLFAQDGTFSESEIVTANGIDPQPQPGGTWSISGDGRLQITRKVTAGTRVLALISRGGGHLATLMRLNSGVAETWFLGAENLAQVQISCFGYSGSKPSAEKFTVPLVSGKTIYWATYPPVVPTSGNEVAVNLELAYGVVTFHPDGTLSKSINNPIEALPDYRPSFTGTWHVDEKFGVLNTSAGLYTTEITLLLHNPEEQSLLVGTTSGTEQWFLDPEKAKEDLATHLATAVHLDPGKRVLFA